jgi:hypothetical protein
MHPRLRMQPPAWNAIPLVPSGLTNEIVDGLPARSVTTIEYAPMAPPADGGSPVG